MVGMKFSPMNELTMHKSSNDHYAGSQFTSIVGTPPPPKVNQMPHKSGHYQPDASYFNSDEADSKQPRIYSDENSTDYRRQRNRGCLSRCADSIGAVLKRKKWYWYLFVLISAAGLIYQLQNIAVIYFDYETVTELRINVPENLTAPAVSLCFPYFKIFVKGNFLRNAVLTRKFKNTTLYDKLSNSTYIFGSLKETEGNLTIEDLFDLTPNAEELIVRCQWKTPNSYVRSYKDGSCEGLFRLEKFYSMRTASDAACKLLTLSIDFKLNQQYICYMITINPSRMDEQYGFDFLQNSLITPGMFYEVSMNATYFAKVEDFQAIIHSPHVKPRGNKAFPVVLSRVAAKIKDDATGDEITVYNNYFHLSYAIYINRLLAKPFKTDCLDYEKVQFESQAHCVDYCLTTKMKLRLSRVPFSAVQVEPIKEEHLTVTDNENKTIRAIAYRMEQNCAYECRQTNCIETIYVTKYIRAQNYEMFTVRIYVTNEPLVESQFKSKTSWSEFVIQALSCFGIWFGLSLYSFISIFETASDYIADKRDQFLERRRQLKEANRTTKAIVDKK